MAVVRLTDGAGGEHRYINLDQVIRFQRSGSSVDLVLHAVGTMTESFGSTAAADAFCDNLAEVMGLQTAD